MRHRVSGRKLGRTKDKRKLLFRSLIGELILHGRIKTTIGKAKTIRPLVDKLVTHAKKTDFLGKRAILAALPKDAAAILINHVGPAFKDRVSGFTRIIHVGERSGDNAEIVILEWVEKIEVIREKQQEKRKKTKEVKETTLRQGSAGQAKVVKVKNKVPRKRRIVKKS